MPHSIEQLTGVLTGVKWRSSEPDSDFCIATLESGETVKGDAPPEELIDGITYRFFGQWDTPHPRYGKSFKFKAFSRSEPHSRFGMVKYLARYAPHVGPRIAGKLFDLYQSDACRTLRTDPERVAHEVPGLTLEKSREAARALTEISELEDVKIELVNLFAGRGFPGVMVDQVLRKFGPLAPQRIQRDPFSLLVYGFTGAGFSRCDRLYMDLGLSPGRLKRQMICLWHVLKSDSDGHTWFPVADAESKLKQQIAGVQVNLRRAVRLGIRSGWLAIRKDERDGTWWIAEGQKAANEKTVAECLAALMQGPVLLPRFSEPLEGECDSSDVGPKADCPVCHGRRFVEIPSEDWSVGGTREIYCPKCMSAEAQRKRGESVEQQAGRVNGCVQEEELGDALGDELDTDQLLAIGRKMGICQWCGRRLIHPVSVALGIGPVCAERAGVKWDMPGLAAESGKEAPESPITEAALELVTA